MFTRFVSPRLVASPSTPACLVTSVAYASSKAKPAAPKKVAVTVDTKTPKTGLTAAGRAALVSKAELEFFRARKKYLEAEQAIADANKEVQLARRRVTFLQALADAASKKDE